MLSAEKPEMAEMKMTQTASNKITLVGKNSFTFFLELGK